MSMKEFLEQRKIDEVSNDEEFMLKEHDAMIEYLDSISYNVTEDDIDEMESRGCIDDFTDDWLYEFCKNAVDKIKSDYCYFPLKDELLMIETRLNGITKWVHETYNVSLLALSFTFHFRGSSMEIEFKEICDADGKIGSYFNKDILTGILELMFNVAEIEIVID